MEKIRTALVGCGKVGHTHASALSTLPESDFVAVCDRNLARAQAFAEQYGTGAYIDIQDMVTEADVQAVVVCTPHPLHAQPTILAAQAGAHVLVEKPMAACLGDCDAMVTAADEAGVKLGVISQRRLYEPVQRVKTAVEAGKIGRPVLGTVVVLGWRDAAYYRSDPWRGKWDAEGGGVLVNQAPHQLDLLQWFMGPIDELFGYWGNLNHPYIEVEDTAVAVLRFKNGGLGSIVVSNSQKPGIYGKVHVHGENGASVGVQTDGGAMFIAGMSEVLEPPVNDLWTVPGEEHLLAKWQAEDRTVFQAIDPATHYHRLQDQDFLRVILNDREPTVMGVEGRKLVEIFTSIYRSQRDHRPARFPLPADDGWNDFDGRLGRK
jgi:UDP-N-acetyl-2-amino-2-deoxyglucuronate dehydrogenase